MTRGWLQFAGLIVAGLLAAAILYLIGHTFDTMMGKATPDGKVPIAEGGLFTALLLSFREVIAIIKGLWDHADRQGLTEALSNSAPTATPNLPAGETA